MNECIHTSYPYKLLCACMYVICMYNLTLFFVFFCVCVLYAAFSACFALQ